MGSKKELIEDLWKKPHSLKRQTIIERAKKGVYHDFESELAGPKLQLHMDLTHAGYDDLAERCADGVYDDEPTAEQVEKMRQEIGPEFFDQVIGKPRPKN